MTLDEAFNLAQQHHAAGRLAEAEGIYRQILQHNPSHAPSLQLLAMIASQVGRHDDSIALNRRAIELAPNFAEAHSNLGVSYIVKGDLDSAIECFRRAVEIRPNYFEAYCNLGGALSGRGLHEEAVAALRRAVEINPQYADGFRNLGISLAASGQSDLAIEAYQRAIQIRPANADAHSSLAVALSESGQMEDAISTFRTAVILQPQDSRLHSNLVYGIQFHPQVDARINLEESRIWARRHEDPLKPRQPKSYGNDRSPDRRLRIGYVSPDFRLHAVGRFIKPLLANHDHQQFEIFCYSSVYTPDATTTAIQASADEWRNIVSLSDEQAAQLIQQDQIDVLIDLTMHMANNRLPLFARKPAPVQVTYLAYAGTTGLDSIDYRITDPYLDPPGSPEPYTEKSIRLPSTYWCYEPPLNDLEITPPPSVANGFITFGCLNSFFKVGPNVLDVWAKLLAAVPDSRLILHTHIGNHRDRIRETFSKRGVNSERISFVPRLPLPEYLRQYNNIDIALDPFPYVGGTTTCDALWMGAPVITLRGNTALSRGGVSILSNIKLSELIADTTQQYIESAANLANDAGRLAHLRSTLRDKMRASPLMDAPQFARDMETAYRTMWKAWCAGLSHSSLPDNIPPNKGD